MEVVIIGAGIAGLAAADELTRTGIKPTVIEARNRIGGRVFTRHDDRVAAPIELGAEFVHGRPAEISDLAKRFDFEIVETGGDSWRLNDDGILVPVGDEPPGSDNELWTRAEEYVSEERPDVSFEHFLELPITANISNPEKEWSRRYVAGFHAADLQRVGIYGLVKTQKADEEVDGQTAHRMPSGYSSLATKLYEKSQAAGAKYLLGNVVTSVRWGGPAVEIVAANSNGSFLTLNADKVIITVPIGVLKASEGSSSFIRFEPDIAHKRPILDKIEMGSARRIILAFSEKWWRPILEKFDRRHATLGFLFAQDVPISVWWTNEPSDNAMLVGWMGGEKAREVTEFTDEQLTDLAVSSLDKIFRTGESFITGKLTASFSRNWDADRFSLGSYTYMGIGGVNAPEDLARRIEDKLYFAGEATDVNGHWGTVHGAIASGIRAVREIVAAG
jgi:monoamine oxidase